MPRLAFRTRALAALVLAVLVLGGLLAPLAAQAQTLDAAAWGRVLARYVDARGYVDYAGVKRDRALAPVLASLAAARPDALPPPEQIAFWLNAYNAGAIALVAEHYPVVSIQRITPSGFPVAIPGTAQSPFKVRFLDVGGARRTLDEIEHEILRRRFREPRIHAALVCAAVSCPPLRREPYTGARLGAQLDDQMRVWLNDRTKNRIPDTRDRIALSAIFDWFRDDFGGSDAAVQRFLAPYASGDVAARLTRGAYRVRHLPYDWRLNDARRR